VRVEILCADPGLAYRGEWPSRESPDGLVRRLMAEARARGMPIQLTIAGHGTWSIAANGRVVRGALFLEKKLASRKGREGRCTVARSSP